MPNFLSDKLMSTALKCSSQLMLGALLIGILGFTSQSYAQSSEVPPWIQAHMQN